VPGAAAGCGTRGGSRFSAARGGGAGSRPARKRAGAMRIDGWRIEGFGIFRDWEMRGLGPGLTVFLGANEAGKSTLLAFLRGVLFGFPGRRSRWPQYPPMNGGRHGGSLVLCRGQEEIWVERVAGRKNGLRVNGRESNGEELQELLGGADENVF